jgi:ATP synthase protein I
MELFAFSSSSELVTTLALRRTRIDPRRRLKLRWNYMQQVGQYGILQTMPDTDSHGNNAGNNYARLAGLGVAFILTLGILSVVGFFVDRSLGTLPLFLLVGLAIGFAGWLYYLYLALKKLGN